MAKQCKFYAVVLPGLEKIAAAELSSLSAHDIEIEHGGVNFTGTMQLLYRINLRSRTITRVLMRLRTFRSMTLEGLAYDLQKVAWHVFFDEHTTLDVQVNCHRSRLNHSDDIVEHSIKTIQQCLPKMGTSDQQKHGQTLHIRIENNRGTLSLDTSGERLDRRGYRLESGKAPIRETIAAATLQWMSWKPEQTLLNPMCGSGTFAIEAALSAQNVAANSKHDFALLHWASFKEKEYQKTLERCLKMQKTAETSIFASDLNESALQISKNNAQRAEVEQLISISKLDIHQLVKPKTTAPGLLIINPPYGGRIGDEKEVMSLWSDIGNIIRQQFLADSAWRTAIICPEQACEKALKLSVKRRLPIAHGGLNVMILEV
ncbi:MAG: RNA methyltransferase [Ghiorsea sp.]